jgi:hypothetical protein
MAEPISGRASRLVTASALAGAILLSATAASAVAPATQGASPDWSRYIIGLLPAIEVCVRDVPQKPAVVTGAYRLEGARIGVRLRGPAGQRWACTARANGRGSGSYESLAQDDLKPGEGDPLLTFGQAPQDECRKNEPLVDPSTGQLMGWFSYDAC